MPIDYDIVLQSNLNSLRILVAEDDHKDIFLLRCAFTQAGVTVPLHFVYDGEQAIDYLEGNDSFSDRRTHPFPTLVLLDNKMPRLSGLDVLKWLRQQPRLRRLPVLIFSSSSLLRDINLAADLGANAYLVKPNTLEELRGLVRAIKEFWCDHHWCADCHPN